MRWCYQRPKLWEALAQQVAAQARLPGPFTGMPGEDSEPAEDPRDGEAGEEVVDRGRLGLELAKPSRAGLTSFGGESNTSSPAADDSSDTAARTIERCCEGGRRAASACSGSPRASNGGPGAGLGLDRVRIGKRR